MKPSLALVVLFAALTTIGCDRVTKRVAESTLSGAPGRSLLADTVRLQYAENTGGFLGLGAEWPRAARTAFLVACGELQGTRTSEPPESQEPTDYQL